MAEPSPAVLCGDIGGTNSRLAIVQAQPDGVRLIAKHSYTNTDAGGLGEFIRLFLGQRETPETACLAVAGPTDGKRVRLTNLAWEIDGERLGEEFGCSFRLINDFEAVAWGLDALASRDLATLQPGTAAERAPRIALGPGTGLGVAQSIWRKAGYAPVPGEGGHITFAPADAEQLALLRFMQGRFGRVSVERILSGPGMADLYAFCRTAAGLPADHGRTPAEITEAALSGRDDASAQGALRLFVRILGQTAGDLALISAALGGVYLAGGIPPRILPALQNEEFLAGFHDKGRFTDWMRRVPVHVVVDPDIGLKGAALAAYSMPSRSTR